MRSFNRRETVTRLTLLFVVGLAFLTSTYTDVRSADVNLRLISLEGPTHALTGEPLGETLSATIRNTGSEAITTTFYVTFYVSADTVITTDDEPLAGDPDGLTSLIGSSVDSLGPGEDFVVSLPADLIVPDAAPTGTVYLGVVVDAYGQVAETDESDNTLSSAITIFSDADGDGVPDDVDLCPDEDASNRDANGDGCVDEVTSARHIEYWDAGDFPLPYVINENGAPGIADGSDFAAVQAGMDAWSFVPGGDVSLSYGGATPQVDAQALDGVNLVTFTDPDFVFPAGVIAVGISTSFTEPAFFNGELVRPGKIVDADMIFNPTKSFSTPSAGSGTDLQSVTTHEAGHLIGISHSCVVSSTMFYVLPRGTNASSLEVEDELMLINSYPDSITLAGASRLRGAVTGGYDGLPVAGAAVFAIDAATGDTLGCDYTSPGDGSYVFLGLPDGDYYVAVHPLNGTSPIGFIRPININALIYETAETNFGPEYWDALESNTDDPMARDAVTVVSGATVTADIITNIDDTPPFVVATLPDSNAADVVYNGSILIAFSEAIDSDAVAGNFALTDSAAGTFIAGNAAILNDDSLLAFIPAAGLSFSTTYKLRLDTGLTDKAGNGLAEPFVIFFRTGPRPPVGISSMSPAKAVEGAVVVVNGFGFDANAADNTVSFDGTSATLSAADPSRLVVTVPAGATSGPVEVQTPDGSATYPGFTVLSAEEVPRGAEVGVAELFAVPRAVISLPDGSRAFVATDQGLAVVGVDPGSPEFLDVATIPIAGGLNELAATPDGARVYAVSRVTGRFYRIDASGGGAAVLSEIDTGAEPKGVIVDPTGRRAFVPTGDGNIQIWDVNTESPTFDNQIGVILSPDINLRGKMATDPAGEYLLVPTGTGNLLVFDLGPDSLLAEIPVGPDPRDVVVDPLGERAYVTDETGSVAVVSLSGFFHVQDVVTGGTLRGAVMTPAGSFVNAVNRELNLMDVVDLRQGSPTFRNVAATIPQRINPVDIAMSPDGFYTFTISEAERNLAVTAIGLGPVLEALSRIAGPEGARVVLAGSGFDADSILTASFNGVTAIPERRSAGAVTVSVPPGATSGPVTVIGSNPPGPALTSNAIFFEVLAPTPSDNLRPAAAARPAGGSGLVSALAASPDGRLVFVGGESGRLFILDSDPMSPTFNQFVDSVTVVATVDDIVVAPGGRRAFVVEKGSSAVPVLDVNRDSPDFGSVLGTLDISSYDGSVSGAQVSPDGTRCVVANESVGQIHIFDIEAGSPDEHQILNTVSLYGEAGTDGKVAEMAYHPTGEFLYLPVRDVDPAAVLVLDVRAESPAHEMVVGSVLLDSGPADEIPISISFTPDGSRCLLLTTQLAGPAGRTAVMLDTSTPDSPFVSFTTAIATTAGPVEEHIDVSPRGDRAILNIREAGFFNYAIQTDPDSLVLIEQTGDVFHHLTTTDNDYSPDASLFYSVSAFRDSVFIHDFTAAQSLVTVSGDGQSGIINQPLSTPLRVKVATAAGDPIEGVPVAFNVTSGGGVFVGTDTPTQIVATGADGIAETRWLLGATVGAGVHTADATASGLSGSPLQFTADGLDDPALLPLVVADVTPMDGKSDVSVTTAIQTVFTKAVDPASIGPSTFFLHKGDFVPVPAVVGFANGNTRVSLTPMAALETDGTYTIEMTTGILDESFAPLSAAVSSGFATSAPPPLAVTSISPPSGSLGIPAVLSGTGFSADPSENTVLFNTTPAFVTRAGTDFINVTVPVGAADGPVRVIVGADTSNAVEFNVLGTSEIFVDDEVIASVGTGTATRTLTIAPDGAIAYAVSPEGGVVIPIDIENLTAQPSIQVGESPLAVVVNPEGTRAYVANSASGTVSVIDVDPTSPTFHQVVETIAVGTTPIDLAISPDGDRLVVVNGGSNELSIVDTDNFSETYNQVLSTVSGGSTSTRTVVISPDGALIYVGTNDGYVVLDATSYGVVASATSGSSTKSISITPDGAFLVLLTTEGDVDIYDIVPGSTSENQVVATVGSGTSTKSVSITPDGAFLYLVQEENDVILVLSIDVLNSVSVRESGVALPPTGIELAVVDTIAAGEDPSFVAFDPRGTGVVAISNAGDNTVSIIDPARSTQPIVAEIEVTPRTLNEQSKGRYVTGRIELPGGYDAVDIDRSTVKLQGAVSAEPDKWSIEDKDEDGLDELVVKFDRAAFQEIIPQGEYVPVEITGEVNGRVFAGSDTIRTIRPTIVTPAGGETVVLGQMVTISWTTPEGVSVDAVDVHWSSDDGAEWTAVAEQVPNTGSVPWSAPLDVSMACRVMVTLYRGGEDIGSGMSPEMFAVVGPVAVTLGGFDGMVEAKGVMLRWHTVFEQGVEGFHVLRAGDEFALYERITADLIGSKGRMSGASYEFKDDTVRPNETYFYKLEEVSEHGAGQVFGPYEVTYNARFALEQNAPNPFNPTTRIRFTVPSADNVFLAVYDVSGRKVRTLVDERRRADHYEVEWDGRDANGRTVSSGVYFYKITVGKHAATRKMLMLK
jgi:YVTN family beta-propeller protein